MSGNCDIEWNEHYKCHFYKLKYPMQIYNRLTLAYLLPTGYKMDRKIFYQYVDMEIELFYTKESRKGKER